MTPRICVGVPSLLLKPIPVDDPPDISVLINAKQHPINHHVTDVWEARFNILLIHYLNQTKNVGIGNRQIDNIYIWNQQHESTGETQIHR